MQEANPSTTLGDRGRRGGYLGLAGVTMLTLAMLAGVGLWLGVAHRGGSNAARVQLRHAVVAPVAAAAQPAIAQPAIARPKEVFTYYLVGSQQQAEELRNGLQHLVPAPGASPSPYEIAVVTWPAEEIHALQEIQADRRESRVSTPPAVQVVDLRTPLAQASTGSGVDTGCEALLPVHC